MPMAIIRTTIMRPMQNASGKKAHKMDGLSSRTSRLRLPFGGIAAEHIKDAADPAFDPAGKIAGLKARNDGGGNDDGCQSIGQRAFETVANLDAHLVLVRGDEKKHAVVLLRLPELPGAEQFIGIGLDVAALQRRHRGNHELDSGLLLQVLRFPGDVAFDFGVENPGLIDDTARQRREVERGS